MSRRARAVVSLRARLISLALLGSAACARNASHVGATADSFHYRVRLSAELERMDVELCFEGAPPRALRPGKDEGSERIEYVRWLRPGPVRRLPLSQGRIRLDEGQPDGCIAYGVKLVEGGALGSAVRRVGRDLIASPNVWLWRPERITSTARATLRFELPDGVRSLVPWPEQGRVHALDATAFRFDSYAAFGRFASLRTRHRQIELELALLDGKLAIDGDAALRWFRSAVDVLAQSEGSFPARRIAALVVPSGAGGDPVAFGMIARGGDPSLLLLVAADATEPKLVRDWVVPHELSHLLIPFIEREHAWLSEGLATYYQEVLRARAGLFDERAFWSRLVRFMRPAAEGAATGSLVAESARMHDTGAYRRVYWGGAAFWLMQDVAVRSASNGEHTLDTLLSTIRRDGALREPWSARALLERLDAASGTDVFTSGFRAAELQPFPDFESCLEQLGVRIDGGAVELDDTAPLARIRGALTAPVASAGRAEGVKQDPL